MMSRICWKFKYTFEIQKKKFLKVYSFTNCSQNKSNTHAKLIIDSNIIFSQISISLKTFTVPYSCYLCQFLVRESHFMESRIEATSRDTQIKSICFLSIWGEVLFRFIWFSRYFHQLLSLRFYVSPRLLWDINGGHLRGRMRFGSIKINTGSLLMDIKLWNRKIFEYFYYCIYYQRKKHFIVLIIFIS